MSIRQIFNDFRSNERLVKQTSVLFLAQISVVILGVFIKMIQTRSLTKEEYGTYAFFALFIGITSLIFRFGYFASLKVLVAHEEEEAAREFTGLGIIVAAIIGVLHMIAVIGLSFYIDDWFSIKIAHILRSVSFLCFIFPFTFLIKDIGVGSNNIHIVSLFEVLSKGLFTLLLACFFLYLEINVRDIILLNLGTIAVAVIVATIQLKPKFNNLKVRWAQLKSKHKTYGFKYYTGASLNQTTYLLDGVFISKFKGTTELGLYALATMICAPISLFSQALSSSYFKKMSEKERIPRKLFIYNTVWLVGSIGLVAITANYLVQFLFGSEYSEVAQYVAPLSVAFFFQGLYAPYTFLAVKSKGSEIRNVAIIEAVINVIGNAILVPTMGVFGAIYASILARMAHFIALAYYYWKYIQEIK